MKAFVVAMVVIILVLLTLAIWSAVTETKVLATGTVVDVFAPPELPNGQIAVRIDDEVFAIPTTSGAAAQVRVGQEITIIVSKNAVIGIYLREF